MKELETLQEMKEVIRDKKIAVVICTMPSCGVCVPLKSKITEMFQDDMEIGLGAIDLDKVEEVKGAYQVYTAPIILLFVEGKEVKRYSAAISMGELKTTIERYSELVRD